MVFVIIIKINYIRIICVPACTGLLGGEIEYWCDWGNDVRRLVSSQDARASFPHVVIAFFESKFDFVHGGPIRLDNSDVVITRKMHQLAKNFNISFDPKINIVRDLGLEKGILSRPSNRIGSRRHTEDTRPKSTVAMKNVPIGARGRKRRTVNVLYLGFSPNLDGRTLTRISQQQSNVQIAPNVDGPNLTQTPLQQSNGQSGDQLAQSSALTSILPSTSGNRQSTPVATRTYSRARISPFRRLTFSPSPPTNVCIESADDTTIEILDDVSMGSLHYESSE